jgi:hypothetical protein
VSASQSITRTIRIDEDVDDFLRRFSDKDGVSVNFLVNKALRKLVEWDIYAEKFGIVAVPSSLVRRMMDYLSDDQARELGSWVGKNLIREFVTFWFKEVSFQTIVKGYPKLAAQYGHSFEYEEHVEGGRWVIVIKHGMGHRWSLYYEELVKSLFRELLHKEAAVDKTEDQVVARFSIA